MDHLPALLRALKPIADATAICTRAAAEHANKSKIYAVLRGAHRPSFGALCELARVLDCVITITPEGVHVHPRTGKRDASHEDAVQDVRKAC